MKLAINRAEEKYLPVTYELPFPRAEYATRLQRVRNDMAKAGVDAAIITLPRDFSWLTGTRVDYYCAESPQWMIVWDGEPVGIVRHLEALTHRCCSVLEQWVEYPDEGPINPFDPVLYTARALEDLNLGDKHIGINYRVAAVEDLARFQELLPRARFADFRAERIRVRRSPAELECIRLANDVNRRALAGTIEAIQPGWSEWEMMTHLAAGHAEQLQDEYFYSAMGGTVCQVGNHMLHMHALRTPAERKAKKIEPGDGAWIEPGVFVKDYVGCMIRTFWLGEPPHRVREAMDATSEAFERLRRAMKPGRTSGEVDAAARKFLTQGGFEMQHRSGYMANERWMDGGIMSLTPGNPLILQPGHVFHTPIHVFLPGIGYVGSSEQVRVTESGCEVIGDQSVCPRELHLK
ncbi:MAG TPA: Xaa-Pro peptidase family protein [Burkholderiales bacterium]|nr:Xaa-Pro peptidase family protein [Burkholderiales bacterium]